MAQLKSDAHEAVRRAAQRGTLMTEGDSGAVLVNRLYERKPWWLIAQALNQLDTCCPETLPESLRLRYQLCERNFALRQLHTPDSHESLALAQRRISFEELLFYQAALSILRGTPGRAHPIQADDGAAYWSSLSYAHAGAKARL